MSPAVKNITQIKNIYGFGGIGPTGWMLNPNRQKDRQTEVKTTVCAVRKNKCTLTLR